MRHNRSGSGSPAEAAPGWSRVTSMARWVARRREAAGARPRLSVVMPVYNAEATLAECLTRLSRSSFGDFEIVLVDDGSTDQSRAIAAGFPLRVVPTAGRIGPAAARNLGADAAEGELLFFLDADVMVRPDTLSRIVAAFERDEIEGVIGVQAAEMRHRDLVSQYKNLWMRWTYCRRRGEVPLFYTTAAAIRRDAFLRAGGFDQGYATPNVEDTAFGQKLARLGIRVCIDPELEVEHVRRYSLAQNNTSVPLRYMASVPLATLGVPALIAGAALGSAAAAGAGGFALAGTLALNGSFLAAIRGSEGTGRALAAIPLLWLELLVVGAGTGIGMLTYGLGRRY